MEVSGIMRNSEDSTMKLNASEPISCRVFTTDDMVRQYPPHIFDQNKRLAYRIACPEGCSHGGELIYSRWNAMLPPASFTRSKETPVVELREDVFGYEPVSPEINQVDWYLNFADQELFVAYGSGLLAQDEMQAAEHPALGSLREALIGQGLSTQTEEGGRATPILVMGVERRCAIATDRNIGEGRPVGLYGNNFSRAGTEVIRKATRPIVPPTLTNILAMTALSGGRAAYRRDEIEHTLETAYTGFSAAKIESRRARNANVTVVIHTGFWGCGAYGGNRTLMTLLQVLAATVSGIDRLVFHTFDGAGTQTAKDALKLFDSDIAPVGVTLSTAKIIDAIVARGFSWGESDGN